MPQAAGVVVQECGVGLGKDDIDIIRNAIDKKLLPIDLYLCAKDSMVSDVLAADLKGWIRRELGARLQLAELFDAPTINTLAARLCTPWAPRNTK